MSYGIHIVSDNGRYVVSTEAKSYCYVGKATRTAINFASSQPGIGKKYYYSLSGGNVAVSVSSITAPAGTAKLQVAGSCGSLSTYEWAIPDASAIATYTIQSATKPLAFVRSTATASGTVASTVYSGGVWVITVLVGYNSRVDADAIEVYCFSAVSGTPSGYGLALYGADGSVTYHSGKKVLQPAGVVTINSVTTNGTSVTMDYDVSAGVAGVAKPCVLATDWFRATLTTKAGDLSRALLSSTFNGCYYSGCNLEKVVAQDVVNLGFFISGSTVTPKAAAVLNTAPVSKCNGTQLVGTSVYTSLRTVQLPITFPVIDGAFYD